MAKETTQTETKKPAKTDIRWRVSVDLIHGDDFMLSFDDKDNPEKACKQAVLEAHKNGFVINPADGQIHQMSNVKRMHAHEYEVLSTPNPAGVGSPVAARYGGGLRKK